jgi:hypothetical protein
MPDRTPAEFAAAAQDREITWWPIRDCSLCGTPIGYECSGYRVAFVSSCGCSSFNGWNSRSWDDLAQHYNMQTNDSVIARYAEFWGFEEASVAG